MTYERIEINPGVMAGKPVIRGTRVQFCDDPAGFVEVAIRE